MDPETAAKNRYLTALYYVQRFEFELRLLLRLCEIDINKTIKNKSYSYKPHIPEDLSLGELYSRLLTFFPKEKHKEFDTRMRTAIRRRNEFIHGIFTSRHGDIKIPQIDVNIGQFLTDKNNLAKVENLITAVIDAHEKILEYSERCFFEYGQLKLRDVYPENNKMEA